MRRCCAGLLLLLAWGCDGAPTPYPRPFADPPLGWGPAAAPIFPSDAVAGGIVGAWLMCADMGCTKLDSSGILFRTDGTWADIEAAGALYCEQTIANHRGTYTWDGVVLTMHTQAGGTMSWEVVINGTIAWISEEDVSIPMVIVAAQSQGPCEDQTPFP
jgi:hypothetical protein